MQSRKASLVEASINVLCGLGVSWAATWLVFPLFGYEPKVMATLWISMIFTGISLIRSYLLRRFFNQLTLYRLKPTHEKGGSKNL